MHKSSSSSTSPTILSHVCIAASSSLPNPSLGDKLKFRVAAADQMSNATEQFAIIASPNEEKEEQKCVIPLESAFSFVSRKYRIVVSLDVSPSMAVQDPDSGDVLLDRARKAIDMCLHSMACLASSNQKQPMDIYLTVLTQGCVTRPVQVLCQGMLLTPANVSNILQRIATQLMESEVAASKTWATICDASGPTWSASDIAYIFKNTTLALDFLPSDATPIVILVTDGVCYLHNDERSFDGCLSQFYRRGIACHVVSVSERSSNRDRLFSYIPDFELLHNLAKTSNGIFVEWSFFIDTLSAEIQTAEGIEWKSMFPFPSSTRSFPKRLQPFSSKLFMLAESLLCQWSAPLRPKSNTDISRQLSSCDPIVASELREISCPSLLKLIGVPPSASGSAPSIPSTPAPCSAPSNPPDSSSDSVVEKAREYTLDKTDLHLLIEARLRDGFTLRDVAIESSPSSASPADAAAPRQLPSITSAVLSLEWSPNIRLDYVVQCWSALQEESARNAAAAASLSAPSSATGLASSDSSLIFGDPVMIDESGTIIGSSSSSIPILPSGSSNDLSSSSSSSPSLRNVSASSSGNSSPVSSSPMRPPPVPRSSRSGSIAAINPPPSSSGSASSGSISGSGPASSMASKQREFYVSGGRKSRSQDDFNVLQASSGNLSYDGKNPLISSCKVTINLVAPKQFIDLMLSDTPTIPMPLSSTPLSASPPNPVSMSTSLNLNSNLSGFFAGRRSSSFVDLASPLTSDLIGIPRDSSVASLSSIENGRLGGGGGGGNSSNTNRAESTPLYTVLDSYLNSLADADAAIARVAACTINVIQSPQIASILQVSSSSSSSSAASGSFSVPSSPLISSSTPPVMSGLAAAAARSVPGIRPFPAGISPRDLPMLSSFGTVVDQFLRPVKSVIEDASLVLSSVFDISSFSVIVPPDDGMLSSQADAFSNHASASSFSSSSADSMMSSFSSERDFFGSFRSRGGSKSNGAGKWMDISSPSSPHSSGASQSLLQCCTSWASWTLTENAFIKFIPVSEPMLRSAAPILSYSALSAPSSSSSSSGTPSSASSAGSNRWPRSPSNENFSPIRVASNSSPTATGTLHAASSPSFSADQLPLPVLGVCILRLLWHSNNSVELQFNFFGIPSRLRASIVSELKDQINQLSSSSSSSASGANTVASGYPYLVSRSVVSLAGNALASAPSDASLSYDSPEASVTDFDLPLCEDPPHIVSYLKPHRWIWTIQSSNILSRCLQILIGNRLREGFTILSLTSSPLFVKEISFTIPRDARHPQAEQSGNGNNGIQLPVLLFYALRLSHSGNVLATEFWLEPQAGLLPVPDSNGNRSLLQPTTFMDDTFFTKQMCDYFASRDLEVLSVLSSFSQVFQHHLISPPSDNKVNEHDYSHILAEIGTLMKIPFNLQGLLRRSRRFNLSFGAYHRLESASELKASDADTILCDRLINAFRLMNDVEIGLSDFEAYSLLEALKSHPTHGGGADHSWLSTFLSEDREKPKSGNPIWCFARAFSDHRILFSLLPTAPLMRQISNGSSAPELLASSFFECSEKDIGFSPSYTGPLRDILLSKFPVGCVLDPARGSTISPGAQRHQEIMLEIQKAMLTQGVYERLRSSNAADTTIQEQDLTSALSSCVEYSLDIDMTEFVQILQAFNSLQDTEALSGLCDRIQESFNSIILDSFERIPGSNHHFVLRPPKPKPSQQSQHPVAPVSLASSLKSSVASSPVQSPAPTPNAAAGLKPLHGFKSSTPSGKPSVAFAASQQNSNRQKGEEQSKLRRVTSGNCISSLEDALQHYRSVSSASELQHSGDSPLPLGASPSGSSPLSIQVSSSPRGSFSLGSLQSYVEHDDADSDDENNNNHSSSLHSRMHDSGELDGKSMIPSAGRPPRYPVVSSASSSFSSQSSTAAAAAVVAAAATSLLHGVAAQPHHHHHHQEHVGDALLEEDQISVDSSSSSMSETASVMMMLNSILSTKHLNLPCFLRMELSHTYSSKGSVSSSSSSSSSSENVLSSSPPPSVLSTSPSMSSSTVRTETRSISSLTLDDLFPAHLRTASSPEVQRTVLRLICLSVSPDTYLLADNDFFPTQKEHMTHYCDHFDPHRYSASRSKYPLPLQENTNILSSSPSMLPINYLPTHNRRPLRRLRKHIQALTSKHMLQQLLASDPISKFTLDKVFQYAHYLDSASYAYFSVPLEFIESRECQRLFIQELETSRHFSLRRVGLSYVAIALNLSLEEPQPQQSQQQQLQQQADPKSPLINVYSPGSSPLPSPMASASASSPSSSSSSNMASAFSSSPVLPYWLILTVREREACVSAFFYCPSVVMTEQMSQRVQSAIDSSIQAVARRVNQLVLLNQLHDTRLCSDLLMAPPASSLQSDQQQQQQSANANRSKRSISPTPPPLSASASVPLPNRSSSLNPPPPPPPPPPSAGTGFRSGHFECPCVSVFQVPLHARLQSQVALRTLTSSIFHPFVVNNRENVFVYREVGGRVFYLRLAEMKASASLSSSSASASASFANSSFTSNSASGTSLLEQPSAALSADLAAYRASLRSSTVSMVLKVYGVDPPSPEITEQLYSLLVNKLSNMTLAVISNLLLRNPLFKMNSDDLEFIRPSNRSADKAVEFAIPRRLLDRPFLYMMLLRQNMLTYLNGLYLDSNSNSSSSNNMNATWAASASSPESSLSASAVSFDEPNQQPQEQPPLKQRDASLTPITPLSSASPSFSVPANHTLIPYRSLDFSFLYNFVPNTFSSGPGANASSIGKGIACVMLSLHNEHNQPIDYIAEPLSNSIPVESAAQKRPPMSGSRRASSLAVPVPNAPSASASSLSNSPPSSIELGIPSSSPSNNNNSGLVSTPRSASGSGYFVTSGSRSNLSIDEDSHSLGSSADPATSAATAGAVENIISSASTPLRKPGAAPCVLLPFSSAVSAKHFSSQQLRDASWNDIQATEVTPSPSAAASTAVSSSPSPSPIIKIPSSSSIDSVVEDAEDDDGQEFHIARRDMPPSPSSASQEAESADPCVRIVVNVWSKGDISADALIQRLLLSVNQVLTKYALETTLAAGTPIGSPLAVLPVLSPSSTFAPFDSPQNPQNENAFGQGGVGQSLREATQKSLRSTYAENLLHPSLRLLNRACDIQAPSVHKIRFPLFLPHWAESDFIKEARNIVVACEKRLNPLVAVAWYQTSLSETDTPVPISSYFALEAAAVSGSKKTASASPSNSSGSQSSSASPSNCMFPVYSIMAGRFSVELNSVPSLSLEDQQQPENRVRSLCDQDLQGDHLFYSHPQQLESRFEWKRNVVCLVQVTSTELLAYTYNLRMSGVDQLSQQLQRLVSWTKCRVQLLSNILHQKIGLFSHCSTGQFLFNSSDESVGVPANTAIGWVRKIHDSSQSPSISSSFSPSPADEKESPNPSSASASPQQQQQQHQVDELKLTLDSMNLLVRQSAPPSLDSNSSGSGSSSSDRSSAASTAATLAKSAVSSNPQALLAMRRAATSAGSRGPPSVAPSAASASAAKKDMISSLLGRPFANLLRGGLFSDHLLEMLLNDEDMALILKPVEVHGNRFRTTVMATSDRERARISLIRKLYAWLIQCGATSGISLSDPYSFSPSSSSGSSNSNSSDLPSFSSVASLLEELSSLGLSDPSAANVASFDASLLRSVCRLSRMTHQTRAPLFFSPLRSILATAPACRRPSSSSAVSSSGGNSTPGTTSRLRRENSSSSLNSHRRVTFADEIRQDFDAREVSLHRLLHESFLHEYVRYLESQDFQLLLVSNSFADGSSDFGSSLSDSSSSSSNGSTTPLSSPRGRQFPPSASSVSSPMSSSSASAPESSPSSAPTTPRRGGASSNPSPISLPAIASASLAAIQATGKPYTDADVYAEVLARLPQPCAIVKVGKTIVPLNPTTVYLQRTMESGGCVLLEISFEGIFARLNVFIIDLESIGYLASSSTKLSSEPSSASATPVAAANASAVPSSSSGLSIINSPSSVPSSDSSASASTALASSSSSWQVGRTFGRLNVSSISSSSSASPSPVSSPSVHKSSAGHQSHQYLNNMSSNIEQQASRRRLFLEQTSDLMSSMHMQSFIHDFQLRNLQSFILDHHTEFPRLDFIATLRDFSGYHNVPTPSAFSRNQIIAKTIRVPIIDFLAKIARDEAASASGLSVAQMYDQLLSFVCQSPDRFGALHSMSFRSLDRVVSMLDDHHHNNSNGGAMSSSDPYSLTAVTELMMSGTGCSVASRIVEDQSGHDDGDVRTEDCLQLQVYFVCVDTLHAFPRPDKSMEDAQQDAASRIPVFEQRIARLEADMTRALLAAQNAFVLDRLWYSLITLTIAPADFEFLISTCSSKLLDGIDSSLLGFNDISIPWPEMFAMLAKGAARAPGVSSAVSPIPSSSKISDPVHFGAASNRRYFLSTANGCQHVIIYSAECRDMVVDVEYYPPHMMKNNNTSSPVRIWICRRDVQSGSGEAISPQLLQDLATWNLSEAERSFISQFVDALCHIIWRLLVVDPF